MFMSLSISNKQCTVYIHVILHVHVHTILIHNHIFYAVYTHTHTLCRKPSFIFECFVEVSKPREGVGKQRLMG